MIKTDDNESENLNAISISVHFGAQAEVCNGFKIKGKSHL